MALEFLPPGTEAKLTTDQAEQEGKLFGRLAFALWVCVAAIVLALWRWL